MSQRRERWELERRLQTACLLVIAAILCGGVAYWLRDVLIPFVLAIFLFQLLDPLVNALVDKVRLPRWLAVGFALALSAAVLLLASSVVTGSVAQLLQSSDLYAQRFDDLLEHVAQRFPKAGDRLRPLADVHIGDSIGSLMGAVANSVVFLVSQSTIVILFLMFLLLGHSPDERSRPTVLDEIDEKIKNYIQVKTALSVFTGVLVGSILWLLDIELAVVFGMLSMLLNFIPNVGSIIATLLPIPILVVSPDVSLPVGLLAFLLPAAVQFFVGNILEPKLLGSSLGLSPVVILLSLTIWASLWGGVGALLAVPMTSVIQILCQKLEFTRPLAALLSGDLIGFLTAQWRAPEGTPGTDVAKASMSAKDGVVVAGKKPLPLEVTEGQKIWWCACGRSSNQPLCDGSHKGTSISPLEYTCEKAETAYLCTCKQTKNPPYCDGSHKQLPAET